jgi:hypothetical protein
MRDTSDSGTGRGIKRKRLTESLEEYTGSNIKPFQITDKDLEVHQGYLYWRRGGIFGKLPTEVY